MDTYSCFPLDLVPKTLMCVGADIPGRLYLPFLVLNRGSEADFENS